MTLSMAVAAHLTGRIIVIRPMELLLIYPQEPLKTGFWTSSAILALIHLLTLNAFAGLNLPTP